MCRDHGRYRRRSSSAETPQEPRSPLRSPGHWVRRGRRPRTSGDSRDRHRSAGPARHHPASIPSRPAWSRSSAPSPAAPATTGRPRSRSGRCATRHWQGRAHCARPSHPSRPDGWPGHPQSPSPAGGNRRRPCCHRPTGRDHKRAGGQARPWPRSCRCRTGWRALQRQRAGQASARRDAQPPVPSPATPPLR